MALPLPLLLAALLPSDSVPAARLSLMPVPAAVTRRDGALRLPGRFALVLRGPLPDGRLERATARFDGRLAQSTGLSTGGPPLLVVVRSPGAPVQTLEEDESYSLTVSGDSTLLRAPTTVGALRGLETLLQLVASDSLGWYLPRVRIEDRPRFRWRGLLIDAGRHWQPAAVIKRQLDGMAAVKLNVLHWHLSEDQGFRVESKRFPRLHELGSDGLYYSQDEIRDIVAYAHDRGIRVVPEFDMPGHTTSWFVGHPELASAPGPYRIERRFGVHAPTIDPTRESTYEFLEQFIAEMTTLFPDRYWHVGGDEVEGSAWRNNSRIRAFMQSRELPNNAALQAHFNRRLSTILASHGRRMVGWDEVLHSTLPTTTVVQSWRRQASLGAGARRGFLGILSAGWYLDHMRTAEYHYLVDPLPKGHTLSPAQAARVLGGEGCMWGEHITPESIDSRIWPRMGAIAERLWSPRDVRDVAEMYRRLDILRARLSALGLGHEEHTPRMAGLLVGPENAEVLVKFLEVSEPIRFGERISAQRLTQEIPLTFLPDAARPDPPLQWTTTARVLAALRGDANARAVLAAAFQEWAVLALAVEGLAVRVPALAGAAPAAAALARASAIGNEAVGMLGRGGGSPAWAAPLLQELDRLGRPQGLLRITVIPAIHRLVRGAGAP